MQCRVRREIGNRRKYKREEKKEVLKGREIERNQVKKMKTSLRMIKEER